MIPFLRDGEIRGRCVGPKFLPFTSDPDALSILRQALPAASLPHDLARCRATLRAHVDQDVRVVKDQPLAVAHVAVGHYLTRESGIFIHLNIRSLLWGTAAVYLAACQSLAGGLVSGIV